MPAPMRARRIGEWVFVPGANCFGDARGLFGGSARRVIVPSARAMPIAERWRATASCSRWPRPRYHAIAGGSAPDLIVGHGVLGRLLARITIASGAPAPTVWETNAARRDGAAGYAVIDPEHDERRDYRRICDASGAARLLDTADRAARQGRRDRAGGLLRAACRFTFPPAFMREARFRVAAELRPDDLRRPSR